MWSLTGTPFIAASTSLTTRYCERAPADDRDSRPQLVRGGNPQLRMRGELLQMRPRHEVLRVMGLRPSCPHGDSRRHFRQGSEARVEGRSASSSSGPRRRLVDARSSQLLATNVTRRDTALIRRLCAASQGLKFARRQATFWRDPSFVKGKEREAALVRAWVT